MWWHDPRILLLRALLLDWFGQFLILAVIVCNPAWFAFPKGTPVQLEVHGIWLIFCFLLYPVLGWLFGSYTVSGWRRLAFTVLLQRLLITAIVCLIFVAIARWLVNPGDDRLVNPLGPACRLGSLTAWSLLIRIALRRGLLLPDSLVFYCLVHDQEIAGILQAWVQVALAHRLKPISRTALIRLLSEGAEPLLVALSPSCRRDPGLAASDRTLGRTRSSPCADHFGDQTF